MFSSLNTKGKNWLKNCIFLFTNIQRAHFQVISVLPNCKGPIFDTCLKTSLVAIFCKELKLNFDFIPKLGFPTVLFNYSFGKKKL